MRQNVAFHIRENDYFGTLATTLDLLRQKLKQPDMQKQAEVLARVRDDLIDLQNSCRIEFLPEVTEENSAAAA